VTHPLKIIFAGTPSFAKVALKALLSTSHQIVAVLTQIDKPAGRGLQLSMSPVKMLAIEHNLPIYQPNTLKDETVQAILRKYKADIMVVAAYGMLLPKVVLSIPRLGCLNIHPSLLPRWRGAAPIQRTIMAGDKVSGVTIMQMDEGLDTGPILLQQPYQLNESETSQTLHDEMAEMGAKCLIETLNLIVNNSLVATPQENDKATYASKITKEEALIDWSQDAHSLEHQIRGLNPKPVAYTIWNGERLKIWMAKALNYQSKSFNAPGTILEANTQGIDIETGKKGILRLLELQLPGSKKVDVKDFFHAKQQALSLTKKFDS